MRCALYAKRESAMSNTFNVGEQLAEILEDYTETVKEVKNKVFKQTAREAVGKLKNTSPRKHGDYARSWTMKTDRDGTVTVYNKEHYRLTHLLENGHVVRNKKGTYGRTNGIKHIKPVEEWGNDAVVERITKEL